MEFAQAAKVTAGAHIWSPLPVITWPTFHIWVRWWQQSGSVTDECDEPIREWGQNNKSSDENNMEFNHSHYFCTNLTDFPLPLFLPLCSPRRAGAGAAGAVPEEAAAVLYCLWLHGHAVRPQDEGVQALHAQRARGLRDRQPGLPDRAGLPRGRQNGEQGALDMHTVKRLCDVPHS